MLKKIWDFLNYWYFRYLMVTELYIVEKWERITIQNFPTNLMFAGPEQATFLTYTFTLVMISSLLCCSFFFGILIILSCYHSPEGY